MKKFFSLSLLLVSLNLHAEQNDSVCYQIDPTSSVAVNSDIPLEICLESLMINTDEAQIIVYSSKHQDLFMHLNIKNLIRKNEDEYAFKSIAVLKYIDDSACGEKNMIDLMISGTADIVGLVNPELLQISVQQVVMNDTCHSAKLTTIYNYLIKK